MTDYADIYHRTAAEYVENKTGRNYLWHDNTLLGIANEGMHVLPDLFHSPVRVTAEEGGTKNLYHYNEYGLMEKQKEDTSLPFGYTGYLKESVSNLYFAGSREYNVESGRLLIKDLYSYMDYQDPSSLNLYAYAKANPLKYLDYDGHECIEEKNYFERSLEMIILGDYSDEVTLLGLAGSVALGVLGLDFPADIRDLTACFTVNFDPSDPMWWMNLGSCAVSFLPLVGGLKYVDEGAELLKYSDEAAEALKHTDEAGKAAKHLDEVVETGSDVHPELDELEKFYDEIYEQQRTPCLEYEEYLDELKKLQDNPYIISESGSKAVNNVSQTSPFDLQATHSQTLSKKNMNKLIDDIKNNGINETIKYVEYNGQKYVVDGHHRLIASKRLGLEQVPIEQVELPYAGYKTVEDLLWFD